jgi:hypothetical protein
MRPTVIAPTSAIYIYQLIGGQPSQAKSVSESAAAILSTAISGIVHYVRSTQQLAYVCKSLRELMRPARYSYSYRLTGPGPGTYVRRPSHMTSHCPPAYQLSEPFTNGIPNGLFACEGCFFIEIRFPTMSQLSHPQSVTHSLSPSQLSRP